MSHDSKEKPSWGRIHQDLQDALATWEELTAIEGRKTPEEEKLAEVRRILASLQEKMKELEA